jgi:2-polyprenyl-6-methoxyphenol hydroxylase-like FAD-dependent oxidoreductase
MACAMANDLPVLIVGAGPVGLVLAKELSHHGIRCMLIEGNLDTTRWPKMDITNCRSMELLRRLGLEDGLRQVGVPSRYSFDVVFSTGLAGKEFSRWALPSVDAMRERIREHNDGTMPAVPYQRCSQEVFEAWMKRLCEADPLIDVRSGWRFDSLTQDAEGVTATVTDTTTNTARTLRARYLVGCDGATSAVRKSVEIPLQGRPVPRIARQVHFKSRDLTALHAHGQFWHIFFATTGTLISQDEVDTWTLQRYYPPDQDPSGIPSEEVVMSTIGRRIEIDRILVTSVWQGNLLVADRYRAGRVFLAGDSAHQNIPTGGYGMNTGVGDAIDIGWKLAAMLQGWGGPSLLASYEIERRPVAVRNVARSERHANVHVKWRSQMDRSLLEADTPDGAVHRAKIDAIIQTERGENEDHGIELGYRYEGSPVVVAETGEAPMWSPRVYTPTTWPGGRPPSVILEDGSMLFDQFGKGFTLLDFADDREALTLVAAATSRGVPMQRVVVHDANARRLYERNLVLVRPDQHIAWRGDRVPRDPLAMVDHVRGVALSAEVR